jgi:hypothetical protein
MFDSLPAFCPYCNKPAQLVSGDKIYRSRPDLKHLKFWLCEPCDAYVGCHRPNVGFGDGTRPLGSLANAELRTLRNQTHAKFDPIWKSGGLKRTAAYQWLADQLGIPVKETHIAQFNKETCKQALSVLETKSPITQPTTPIIQWDPKKS